MMKNRTSISACPQIVPTIPCINYSASLNLLDVLLSPILQINPPGSYILQFKVMLKGPPFNVLQVSRRALITYSPNQSPPGSYILQFKVMLKGPPFNVELISPVSSIIIGLIPYTPFTIYWRDNSPIEGLKATLSHFSASYPIPLGYSIWQF